MVVRNFRITDKVLDQRDLEKNRTCRDFRTVQKEEIQEVERRYKKGKEIKL